MRRDLLNKLSFLVVFALGLLVSGCVGGRTDPRPPLPPSTNDVTSIGAPFRVGDQIKVEFSEVELKTIETEIKEDGTILFPLLTERIVVAGKTAGQLEAELHDAYVPRFYRRLTVTVTQGIRFYIVGGQVRMPDRKPYSGRITVLGAIQSAGGFGPFASRRNVMLTRVNGEIVIVDCIRAQSGNATDPEVFPGDQIFVPERLY